MYKPTRPDYIHERIVSFTKENVPYFFKYAKDKSECQIAKFNNSFVNKLNHIIPNPRINCRSIGLNKIDYSLLMNDLNTEFNVSFTNRGKLIKEDTHPIIVKYCELNKKYKLSLSSSSCNERNFPVDVLKNSQLRKELKYKRICNEVKYELSQYGYTDVEITDILVKFLYGIKESKHKVLLWLCYGDNIYSNIEKHIKIKTKSIQCLDCGLWFDIGIKDNKTCRCSECAIEHKRELTRLRVKKHRESSK